MCHNNQVYLFPTPVCSIISYQLNLASTWCSSLTSPVRNPICSSLCDAWEIWEGGKNKNKNHKGEKGELTRAAVDGMRNRKQVMTDKSVKEEHDTGRKNEKIETWSNEEMGQVGRRKATRQSQSKGKWEIIKKTNTPGTEFHCFLKQRLSE